VAQLATPGGGLVSYARVHYFASETTRALAKALRQGETDGVDGYVWDLRNNPGGRPPACLPTCIGSAAGPSSQRQKWRKALASSLSCELEDLGAGC
jgi:hypothetical protein